MLTYSFTDTGLDPLYEQLYKCLKNDILNGNIMSGARLPSKRPFAKNLGISVITVESAYSQLIAEGYVYSLPKKGFFVSDIASEIKTEKKHSVSEEDLKPELTKSRLIADFTGNQTEPDIFPFSVWSKIMREQLNSHREALMTNPPCGGVLPLREAMAAHLRDFRGMHVEPEQIIIGAGTEYLCGLIIQLLGSDKTYAVEDPGYDKTSKIYNSHFAECRHIPMDAEGIKISCLNEQHADIVHVSPSHHYPTGKVMTIGRRYELLGWAAQSDNRYIIEDDFDSELRLKGKMIPTMQSIDVTEKVIYINTFTKTLSSTIRISYMVLPPGLVKRYYRKMSFYACTVSNFEQYTLASFIRDGSFEKHLNRMRSHYRTKRDLLLELIQKSGLKDKASILEENAGLHFLLKINTERPDDIIIKQAAQKGVRLSSLSRYYHSDPREETGGNFEYEHVFVINYSSVREENMAEAVKILDMIC